MVKFSTGFVIHIVIGRLVIEFVIQPFWAVTTCSYEVWRIRAKTVETKWNGCRFADVNSHFKIHFLEQVTSHSLIEAERCIHVSPTLAIIGSDNGLSPVRRQAIIWTNAVSLSIGPLGTNFSQIVFKIQTFSLKKMHLKMSSGKCRPFCRSLSNCYLNLCWPWCLTTQCITGPRVYRSLDIIIIRKDKKYLHHWSVSKTAIYSKKCFTCAVNLPPNQSKNQNRSFVREAMGYKEEYD